MQYDCHLSKTNFLPEQAYISRAQLFLSDIFSSNFPRIEFSNNFYVTLHLLIKYIYINPVRKELIYCS